MNANYQMDRDWREDIRSDLLLRNLGNAIDAALSCRRVRGTKLAADLEAIRETVGEYRAQITKAWD